MPVKRGKDRDGPYYQWGDSGAEIAPKVSGPWEPFVGARCRNAVRASSARRLDSTLSGRMGFDEDQLVRRARAGDAEAYGELAAPHCGSALRVATVVLGTAEGADDVVQQAMERAWRSLGRFQPGRAFRPWLLRIVANTARNDRRSRGRRAHLAVRAAHAAARDAVVSPEDVVVSELERRRVVAALNRLRAGDRLVVALRHFEQLSEREMAEVLNRPVGTVKSRLARAMGRLRTELERDGRDHEEVMWHD